MVTISVSYVITLYLPYKSRIEHKCSQGRRRYDRRDEKATRMRADQRNGLDIGQVAKQVGEALNGLTKGTAKRGRKVSENQDIPVLLQLIGLKLLYTFFNS